MKRSVNDIRERLKRMTQDDLREFVRKELHDRDRRTLADLCLQLMDRDEMVEWAIPVAFAAMNESKYGKLKETGIRKILPKAELHSGLVKMSVEECSKLTHELFQKKGIRVVCEGTGIGCVYASLYAPLPKTIQEAGMGLGGGVGAGPGGECTCPKCGHKIPHEQGQPCRHEACPKCGAALGRENGCEAPKA